MKIRARPEHWMAYKQITYKQRIEIYALLKAGHSKKKVAELIGVHKSTVHREVKRTTGQRGYRPQQVNHFALSRRHGPVKRIRFTGKLKAEVALLLRLDRSPQQISR